MSIKKILIIIFLFFLISIFWKINNINYQNIRERKIQTINHPDKLPKKEAAKITSFGFTNIKADFYWLQTIQYVGGNAISSKYKAYLYIILDLITELNPSFSHPYKVGLLLLPEYNYRYEDLDEKTQQKHKNESLKIGLKGIKNLCDDKKIQKIIKENDLNKIIKDDLYSNPCKDSDLPYYLAFNYHFHLKKPIEAANYYKITSANKDSLKGARVLAAIMQGKGGDREKSFLMFTNMASSVAGDDKVCSKFSSELQKIGLNIFANKIPFNGEILEKLRLASKESFGEYKDEDNDVKNGFCKNYLNKSIRELNLLYIELANKRYQEKNNGDNALTADYLFEEGYMDYLPIDYQQYENYGIKYEFNFDTGNFDYQMSDYK